MAKHWIHRCVGAVVADRVTPTGGELGDHHLFAQVGSIELLLALLCCDAVDSACVGE